MESRFSNVAGAVLTGGASSRMGSDKSHLAVGGVASATRVARCLALLCEDVVLVGGDPPAEAPGRRAPALRAVPARTGARGRMPAPRPGTPGALGAARRARDPLSRGRRPARGG